MLTKQQWNLIEKQAKNIFGQLELDIIEEIATRIASANVANAVVLNDVKILQELGITYNNVIKLVAKYLKTAPSEIKDILKNAGGASLAIDDNLYKNAGLKPTPFMKTPYMLSMVEQTAKRVNYNLTNLVRTTATNAQQQLYNALNNAYLQTSTGAKSYSQAILDAVDKIKEPEVTYPSGYKTSVESAVRTNIITSVNQMCGDMQLARAQEMGWDLMQITAHYGARPTHALWQGKVVSISGNDHKYLTLQDIGYGEVDGFKGINCRHDWYPYDKTMGKIYTQEQLDQYNNKTVKYNGQEIGYYDATQMQRKMERQIRQHKMDLAKLQGAIKGTNDGETLEKLKTSFATQSLELNDLQKRYSDFSKQTGISTQNERLVISTQKGYNSSIITQQKHVEKIANEFNSNLSSLTVNGHTPFIGAHAISRAYARDVKPYDVMHTIHTPMFTKETKNDIVYYSSYGAHGVVVALNSNTGKIKSLRVLNNDERKKYGIS